MTDIEAIKKYLEWAEEEVLSGNANPTVEQYEEALRVARLKGTLRSIWRVLCDPDLDDSARCLKINSIMPSEVVFA